LDAEDFRKDESEMTITLQIGITREEFIGVMDELMVPGAASAESRLLSLVFSARMFSGCLYNTQFMWVFLTLYMLPMTTTFA